MAKECVFCGGRPTTLEHVLPEWLGELLNPEKEHSTQRIADVSPIDGEMSVQERTYNIFNLQSRIVCQSCNGGWMEFDQPIVRDAVLGTASVLSMDAQLGLARWGTKTSMTFEFSDSSKLVTSTAHRSWLFEKRQPPPGTWVWAGSNSGHENWAKRAVRSSTKVVVDAHGLQPQVRYAASTAFGFGQLVLLVVCTDLGERVPRYPWIDFPIGMDGQKVRGLRRIWPRIKEFTQRDLRPVSPDDMEVAAHSAVNLMARLGMQVIGGPPVPPHLNIDSL